MEIAVIGGGASGLVAAISAARRGKIVTVLEANDRVGKKLLATGNGKCNLTNLGQTASRYNTTFIDEILARYGAAYQLEFFHGLGLLTRETEGRVYPHSELSSSVLNVLRGEAERLGVRFRTGNAVETVEHRNGKFICNANFATDSVILATGSHATFGKESSALAQPFGHRVMPLRPSLVPLLTDTSNIRGLKGVRVKAVLRLTCDGALVATEAGELLFKDNGISGIAVFNLSARIARAPNGGSYTVYVDFFPEFEADDLAARLARCDDPLKGIMHKELAANVKRILGVESVAGEQRMRAAAVLLKRYPIRVKGLSDMTLAQVASGGLDTAQFDARTCESKLRSGFYGVGEALDVDGDCGGYNLCWAWASGFAAGEHV